MCKIEEFNQKFTDLGFVIDGDDYKYVKTSQRYIIINGQQHVQEQQQILHMRYVGDGCELDSESNEIEGTQFCEFEILDEYNHSITTICCSTINEFLGFINL